MRRRYISTKLIYGNTSSMIAMIIVTSCIVADQWDFFRQLMNDDTELAAGGRGFKLVQRQNVLIGSQHRGTETTWWQISL